MYSIRDKLDSVLYVMAERPWVFFLLGFLLYGNTVFHGFNMDDDLVTMEHPLTSQGFSGIPSIVTSPYYEDASGYSYEYRPVTHISFAIEHALFGGTALSGHLINILIYALTCMLVFKLLVAMFPDVGRLFPVLATLLFIVHPMHTEAVASIKNREELLALLTAVGSMASTLRYLDTKRPLWLVAALTLIGCSLLSKISALSLVLSVPLLATFRSAGWHSFLMQLFFSGVILFSLLWLWSWLPIHSNVLLVIAGISCLGAIHILYTFGSSITVNQILRAIMSNHVLISAVVIIAGYLFDSLWPVYVGAFVIAASITMGRSRSWIVISVYAAAVATTLLIGTGMSSDTVFYICSVAIIGILRVRGEKDLKIFVSCHVPLFLIHATLISDMDRKMIEMFADFVLHAVLYLCFLFPFYSGVEKKQLLRGRLVVLLVCTGFLSFLWLTDRPIPWWSFIAVIVVIPALTLKIGRWSAWYFKMLIFVPLVVTVVDQQVLTPLRFGLTEELASTLLGVDSAEIHGNSHREDEVELVDTEAVSQLSGQVGEDGSRVIAQRGSRMSELLGHNSDRPLHHLEYPLGFDATWGQKTATAAVVVTHYIKQMFIPYPQSFYYGYSYFDRYELYEGKAVVSLVILLALVLLALWLSYRRSPAGLGLWIFLSSLALFSNLLEPVAGMAADRLTYVASLGFCVSAGYGLFVMWNRWRGYASVIVVVLLLVFSGMTVHRSSTWKDVLTLMRYDVENIPNSAQAHNLLASNLMQASYDAKAKENPVDMRHEAIHHFRESLRIWPQTLNVWYDLGRAYMTVNEPARALPCFRSAYGFDSTFTDAAWKAALIADQLGQDSTAIQYYNYCIRFSPELEEAYSRLSYLYFTKEEFERSIEVNRMAIAHEPRWPAPYENAAQVFEATEMPDSVAFYIGKRNKMLGMP
jgi:tetratricopeptide (TPR) repeat protein